VDSSAWIALFSRRDQHHAEADRKFREAVASKTPLLTTNLVIAEIHRLLLRRAGGLAAAAALDRIDASPLVKIDFAGVSHHRAAKSWLKKLSAHAISYTDAVSFSTMECAGSTEAITFDRHFSLAGFALYP
jgi:predicted nucleic acid-binding protein